MIRAIFSPVPFTNHSVFMIPKNPPKPGVFDLLQIVYKSFIQKTLNALFLRVTEKAGPANDRRSFHKRKIRYTIGCFGSAFSAATAGAKAAFYQLL
jgi:hypothetical protein